jgi:dihydrofolate reductase
MRVSLIVAAAENGVIGRQNTLPWRLSADLRRFKRLTMGHTIVMGRKTWESIGRPLPGRLSIVITRQPIYAAAGAEIAADFDTALQAATQHGKSEVFVIGGAEIFKQAMPVADRVHLTHVHANVEGDSHFPTLDPSAWRLVQSERHDADEKNEYAYSFELYERA